MRRCYSQACAPLSGSISLIRAISAGDINWCTSLNGTRKFCCVSATRCVLSGVLCSGSQFRFSIEFSMGFSRSVKTHRRTKGPRRPISGQR